jgi:hypothetical protein
MKKKTPTKKKAAPKAQKAKKSVSGYKFGGLKKISVERLPFSASIHN